MTKYLAFDIEILNDIPAGAPDWRAHRPLGISCAATLIDTRDPIVWYAPGAIQTGEALSRNSLVDLVDYLHYMQFERNIKIVTWNGLGFDFPVLADESGSHEKCKAIAVEHIDMMFHFFCNKGYFLALDTAAKGQRLEGKLEGMTGALAPKLWRDGSPVERRKVVRYVKQDVKTTLDVALKCEETKRLRWISKAGNPNSFEFDRWLTVREACRLPTPDQSWMSDPTPRTKLTTWIEELLL